MRTRQIVRIEQKAFDAAPTTSAYARRLREQLGDDGEVGDDTVRLSGELAKITRAIANNGGDFISFGIFSGPDAHSRVVTFKAQGIKKEKIREVLHDIVLKFWDIRQS